MVDSFWYLEQCSPCLWALGTCCGIFSSVMPPVPLHSHMQECQNLLGFCVKCAPVSSTWLRTEQLMKWNTNFQTSAKLLCLVWCNFGVYSDIGYYHWQIPGLCRSLVLGKGLYKPYFIQETHVKGLVAVKRVHWHRIAQFGIQIPALLPGLGQ